jgi:hypothetical protein
MCRYTRGLIGQMTQWLLGVSLGPWKSKRGTVVGSSRQVEGEKASIGEGALYNQVRPCHRTISPSYASY